MIKVYLNGRPVEAREGVTVPELLRLAGRDPALTAVTVDGKFVPRSEYGTFVLVGGERVQARELHDGG